jgi:hypothetical protein
MNHLLIEAATTTLCWGTGARILRARWRERTAGRALTAQAQQQVRVRVRRVEDDDAPLISQLGRLSEFCGDQVLDPAVAAWMVPAGVEVEVTYEAGTGARYSITGVITGHGQVRGRAVVMFGQHRIACQSVQALAVLTDHRTPDEQGLDRIGPLLTHPAPTTAVEVVA